MMDINTEYLKSTQFSQVQGILTRACPVLRSRSRSLQTEVVVYVMFTAGKSKRCDDVDLAVPTSVQAEYRPSGSI